MDSLNRLDLHHSQSTERSKPISFEFDDAPVQAYEGDTIASALYAAGIIITSRSFKYHRPRGLLCVSGRCPNCLMNVDGTPNVRICTQQIREGMQVRHQNAWPSLKRDFLSILDKMDRFMPVGFYYKAFHRPKLFWRISEPIIRRIAGLGKIGATSVPPTSYHHQNSHTDVAIIGGGPAGVSAALAAADSGLRVTLIDDQPSLGGHLRFDSRFHKNMPDISNRHGFTIAKELADLANSTANIEIMSNTAAFGLYEDNLIGTLSQKVMTKIRARRIVMATGSYEIPQIFEGNDLPGVILSTGAQRLQHLYGVRLGSIAVVSTSTDQGYYAALDLHNAGVTIAAISDTRQDFPDNLDAASELRSRGVLILNSYSVVKADGKSKVTAAVLRKFQNGSPIGTRRRFECDVICMSGGFQPATFLLQHAGFKMEFDRFMGESVPSNLGSSLYAVGEVTGTHDLYTSIIQGRKAGLEAAESLGHSRSTSETYLDELRRELKSMEVQHQNKDVYVFPQEVSDQNKKAFVCFCEDVTTKDISDAIEEGFDDIQTLKRYTTTTMGPCQGKICSKSFSEISAQRTGHSLEKLGVTTARPPLHPCFGVVLP